MADVIQPRGPANSAVPAPTQTLGFAGGEQYNVNSSGYATAANVQGTQALGNLGVNITLVTFHPSQPSTP